MYSNFYRAEVQSSHMMSLLDTSLRTQSLQSGETKNKNRMAEKLKTVSIQY